MESELTIPALTTIRTEFEFNQMYEQIRKRLESVLSGKSRPDSLTGSTSVRAAVGLLLDRVCDTNPTMTVDSAREYLDHEQLFMVDDLRSRNYWRINKYRAAHTAA